MEYGGSYGFQGLEKTTFPGLQKKQVQENLTKWSLIDGLRIQAFSFSTPFKPYLAADFLTDFFACTAVTTCLLTMNKERTFVPLGIPSDKVVYEEVPCTATSMEMFDKISDNDAIIRSNGSIIKCIPQFLNASGSGDPGPEIEVADNLRKLILKSSALMDCRSQGSYDDDEEQEEKIINTLSADEAKEFLFQLFGHIVVGGSLCQYEDFLHPYLETTKLIYKDLVSVATSGAGDNRLDIVSHVYRIFSLSNSDSALFSSSISSNPTGSGQEENILFCKQHWNNFLYLVVNPVHQLCLTLYHHV